MFIVSFVCCLYVYIGVLHGCVLGFGVLLAAWLMFLGGFGVYLWALWIVVGVRVLLLLLNAGCLYCFALGLGCLWFLLLFYLVGCSLLDAAWGLVGVDFRLGCFDSTFVSCRL